MRVAVIGAGSMGRTHAAAWRSLGVDTWTVGRDEVGAALAGCDIADICTPTPSHRTLTERAAAAGRPVICEKPLALTKTDAEAMLAACAERGVGLYPAHVVRWFPAYARAHAAVAAGRLGRLTLLRFARHAAAPLWSSWFADPEASGGVITDLLIHDIDAARWLAGEVTGVSASSRAVDGLVGSWAELRLEHAGGAVTRIEGSWGSAGTGLISPFTLTGSRATRSGDGRTGRLNPYAEQLAELARAITTGAPARVSAADGVAAVRIAEQARAAAAAG